MNLLLRMKRIQDLSPSERQIVNYILDNPDGVAGMGIVEISQKTYTSTSTMMRLIKKLNFNSFIDFRLQLSADTKEYLKNAVMHPGQVGIEKSDSLKDIIDKVSSNNARAAIDAKFLNDIAVFRKVVDMMCAAKGIDFYGTGVSNLIAQDAMIKALRVGIQATAHPYYSEMAMIANISQGDRLAFLISYTGQTTDTLRIAKKLRKAGVPSVSITSVVKNPLVEYCDVNLFVDSFESAFRVGGMNSRISALNLLDILFTAFINSNYEAFTDTISKTFLPETFNSDSK